MVAAQVEVALNVLINNGNPHWDSIWKYSEERHYLRLVPLQYIALDRIIELTEQIEILLLTLLLNKRTIVETA